MECQNGEYSLNYKGYHGKVKFSEEDEGFVGEIVGISDSVNFYADREDEIEAMFHQCVDNYLEFCKEIGKKPE